MKAYLEHKGIVSSRITIHKYTNKGLCLTSIVRSKKPTYEHEKVHKKFDNLINQNFKSSGINKKWATDLTYLFLT